MRSVTKSKETEKARRTVRLFKSKGCLAFKLPKGFQVRVKELEVFRSGGEIILRPAQPKRS